MGVLPRRAPRLGPEREEECSRQRNSTRTQQGLLTSPLTSEFRVTDLKELIEHLQNSSPCRRHGRRSKRGPDPGGSCQLDAVS